MTNKTRNKKATSALASLQIKKLNEQIQSLKIANKKKKKATPFADVGGTVGRFGGSFFGNAKLGSSIGRWLGTGIGSIFGSGDYQLAGSAPKYNVLMNGAQIPQFSTTKQTNIICHREYLGDILGTAAFSNTSYPLNPGMANTFPWLSTIAENYQEYQFHGIIFEFRPLITDFVTNGAPGVLIMSTDYNADDPPFATKQQMENAEYAVSTKPTLALIHGIECDTSQTILPHRFVRNGAVPTNQDLRLYDLGNYQLATQTNPVQNLGELWVSYCVEFFKPELPRTVGGSIASAHVARFNVTTANPLGNTTLRTFGTLALTVSPTVIQFVATPGSRYFISITWQGNPSASPFTPPGVTAGGSITFFNSFVEGLIATINAPFPAQSGANQGIIDMTAVANPVGGIATITLGTAAVFGSTADCDIFVTEIDSSITA